jgi:hypothetical protein
MSLTPTTQRVLRTGAPPGTVPGQPRRVRHQALDALAVMAFSASVSVAVAAALLMIARLGR